MVKEKDIVLIVINTILFAGITGLAGYNYGKTHGEKKGEVYRVRAVEIEKRCSGAIKDLDEAIAQLKMQMADMQEAKSGKKKKPIKKDNSKEWGEIAW